MDMEVNLIWPELSFINLIAKTTIAEKLIQTDCRIIESGRSRLLNNLQDQLKQRKLTELRIFVPHINEKEHVQIKAVIINLFKKFNNLNISWFLLKDNPDTKKVSDIFHEDFEKLKFYELEMKIIKDSDIDIKARYYLTRAFLGKIKKPEKHKVEIEFDIDKLKQAIKVYVDEKESDIKISKYFRENMPGIEGFSNPMNELKKRILSIADTELNVLIDGETGAGKEGVAFFIHDLSKRENEKFEVINCALFTENQLVSELFGHVPGAFTGASKKSRPGLLKGLDKGTLFLDELPEMSLQGQAMLLRFLQDGKIKPLGADKYNDEKYDVRIISAGQPELLKEKLREDLWYRIAEVKIDVPPLRKIKEDMMTLVDHYLYKNSATSKKRYEVQDFFISKLSLFQEYSWPGNIRQFLAFVKRRFEIGKTEEIIIEKELELLKKDELLKEINDRDNKKTLRYFMEDFKSLIKKHRDGLPSSEDVKLSYTYYVSEELTPEKTQKQVADKLKIKEATRTKQYKQYSQRITQNKQTHYCSMENPIC